MANLKKWWLEQGWPWLKENWWVLLLLPVLALVFAGMLIWNRQVGVSVIEPLAEADERAKLEAETRIRQLEVEKKRLEDELAGIQKRYAALEASMEQRLADRVDELRRDPEALKAAMLAAGRG